MTYHDDDKAARRAEREYQRERREVLRGLKGTDRRAMELWTDVMHRIGLPLWTSPRGIARLAAAGVAPISAKY
jgi:hypothetical protein